MSVSLHGARQFAGRLRYELRFIRITGGLIVALLRRRPCELWIGDSHSAHLNSGEWPCRPLRNLGDGRWVWHIGPRLMWSVARDGFPTGVRRLARVLGRFGRGDLTLAVAFGEIDIRCHLATRLDGSGSFSFPTTFVEHATDLARLARAGVLIVAIPMPPSDDYESTPEFPILGTLEQRLQAHAQVREALLAATTSDTSTLTIVALDCTEQLTDDGGAFRGALTMDGCHVNEAGRQIVQQRLREIRQELVSASR